VTVAIRTAGVALTVGALLIVLYVTTPRVITGAESVAVITLGSVALVVHMTAGWASRGVKATTTGDYPRRRKAEDRHALQSVTVSEDRDAQ
jgi:hypothetical protein